MPKLIDITNIKFGHLTVISLHSLNSKNRGVGSKWNCKCDCGNEHVVRKTHLMDASVTSCGKSGCMFRSNGGKNHQKWSGCAGLSGTHWARVISSAKKRNIKINIDAKYGWNLYLKQNGKCALTGMSIDFVKTAKKSISNAASLDRIDSNKGYIKGNVQWIHKDLNVMKWNYTQEYFIELCHKISDYNKKCQTK